MITFVFATSPLHGDPVRVTTSDFAELDRAADSGEFANATLRINMAGMPPLTKLNVLAILYKSRHLLSAGMMTVGTDTTPVVIDPSQKNPIFSGGRFSGPALDRFLETTAKTYGIQYTAATQELVVKFSGDKFVAMAVSRRLVNVVKFCLNYSKRFNTSRKFRWETFDSISRLRQLPIIENNVEDQEEV